MGMTAAEKIFAAHAGLAAVSAGEIVVAKPDRMMLHDITGELAFAIFRSMGATEVCDPDKVVLVGDHYSPPPHPEAAALLAKMERFARDMEVQHVFTTGQGIEHTLLPERGLLKPGNLVIGTDSHTCTAGAFSALGTGMGSSDVAAAMALGEMWFMVPETIRATYVGRRPAWITGKDLILALLARITVDGATYKCVEFDGEAIASLNMDERMALCNMTVEGGAKTCFVAPDDTLRAWAVGKHGEGALDHLVESDADAIYSQHQVIDVSELEPQCAVPFSPDNVVPVGELRGTRVNQVYIGNCSNGTMTDLRQAASVLRGRKVAPGVRCIVVPATQRIAAQAAREGIMETLLEAGAIVGPSTCGACAGLHMGVMSDDEVAVATTNRNYRGRMGAFSSRIHLANAWVAAASAVAGEIVHPGEVVTGEAMAA
ncbi:MAG: 3-isopropylmalate dehydratase large subunit [Sphingomonas adhaesiva]|uniref:3-isopropylmalate dehydratase large subunit n=1 Tax=Sphingomonas adhaesiva TaxID=28212 RepID=UPI002FF58CEA